MNRKVLRPSLSFLIAIALSVNLVLIDGYDGDDAPEFDILPVSKGTSVTIYERTTWLNIKIYSVSDLMGSGGSFSTAAKETYTITSDGKHVKIHCYRNYTDGGGHNIEAVKLSGVPGFPSGLWASIIVDYKLGRDGNVSSLVNALGGDYNGTYTRVGDDESELILGFEIEMVPPFLYIEASLSKNDVILNWDQRPVPALDHFLIYRATSQTDFDFSTPWVNTSTEINVLSGSIDPLNTTWIDTNVTNPDHPDYCSEYYYVVRAVNAIDMRSTTSNTAGYHVTHFGAGLNTFSVPLKPFGNISLDSVMNDLGASSVSLQNESDEWVTYHSAPAPNAEMGKGYVIELPSEGYYVFAGEPASMIIYKDGFGFNDTNRDSINAAIDENSNITVSWMPILGADKYYLYRSYSRDGFFTFNYSIVEVPGPSFQDSVSVVSISEIYYLVVPYNATTYTNGSSTYSIGIITAEYNGNVMFGLPLKPVWDAKSADWYVDQIEFCLGIVYLEDGIWKAHFREFREGVYDTTIEYGRGYELTVYMTSIYSYIGW